LDIVRGVEKEMQAGGRGCHWFSLAVPPGAILPGLAGRNMRWRGAPFWNSLSHGCINRVSSVSSSFPSRPSLGGYLAPPVMLAQTDGHPSSPLLAERKRKWETAETQDQMAEINERID
jgi:hypothetical protein